MRGRNEEGNLIAQIDKVNGIWTDATKK